MKIRSHFILATLIVLTHSLSAAPVSNQSFDQIINDITTSLNEKLTDILGQQTQRISYTGLACAAGTAGIVTAYNGLKRLCNGIEENHRKKTYIGSSELAIGLGIAATSIALIHLLWKKARIMSPL